MGNAFAKFGQYAVGIGGAGSLLSSLGSATGSTFLSDAGGLLGSIAKTGVQVSAAGAFATAKTSDANAALVGAAPLATLLASGPAPAPAPAASNKTGMLGPSNAPPKNGIIDGIANALAAPFRWLLGKRSA